MTAALDRSARRGPWPGPGPTDSHLQSITDSFARAVELIHRHGPAGPSTSPAVRADADAARTRIIHTLYIAAHGVRLAVTRYARPLEDAHDRQGQDHRHREPGRRTLGPGPPGRSGAAHRRLRRPHLPRRPGRGAPRGPARRAW